MPLCGMGRLPVFLANIFPAAVFLLLAISSVASAGACPADGMCRVSSGYYMASAPPGWDGVRPLPVLMHFHGYRESAADMMARDDLKSFAARNGILLVVPQGEGNTWSHPGSPSKLRDEFAFTDEVLADLVLRYPVSGQPFLVSGFSQGAAMVWNLACFRGETFSTFKPSGFLAIAGTFWTPQPDQCPSGAQNLIQIHGVADRTVPLEGRSIRNGEFRQGDVFRAVGMMRRSSACPAEASRAYREGALICERMSDCASGKLLDFCLHPGGHDFDASWLDFAWKRFSNLK